MATHSPEGHFLTDLFSALDNHGVVYAVMRNYQELPFSTGGSDVDIYINSSYRARAKHELHTAVLSSNAFIIGAVETDTFYEAFILGHEGDRWWGVCVEFYFGIYYKGSIPLVSEVAINNKFIIHNNICAFDEKVGNALGFIKEIMVHNYYRDDKPQYKQSLRDLLKCQPLVFEDVFGPLGGSASTLLLNTLNAPDDVGGSRNIKRFRFYVIARSFLRSPVTILLKRVRHELSRLKRYLSPPGTVVAVMGVDGAGKSTLIEAINPSLNAATHNAVFYHHLRPGLLPPLARLKGKVPASTVPVTAPHASRPSGTIGSSFRLFYLLLDYFVGYWAKVRPLIAKRPAVVVFDRYAYDMMLDQRRFRIELPSTLVRFFTRFAPKPDLVFCLYGSPEVLAARKNELPVVEVARQIEALKVFAAGEPRAVLINTEQPLEACRDQILQAIVNHCHDHGSF